RRSRLRNRVWQSLPGKHNRLPAILLPELYCWQTGEHQTAECSIIGGTYPHNGLSTKTGLGVVYSSFGGGNTDVVTSGYSVWCGA
ncbi:hypothetical protein ONQ60_27995, partial [Salmonella enterica subsp. enterica serovar Virginia]|nr:hypothetical protein [Salmonella enterica subsp. enterica serovar Virginia]